MMRRIGTLMWVMAISAAAIGAEAGTGADAKPESPWKQINPAPFKVTADLAGNYESTEMWPVGVHLDEWNTTTLHVVTGIPQGTAVHKGDNLIRFDTTDLDRIITDTKMNQQVTSANIAALREDVRLSEISLPLEQKGAKDDLDRAKADYASYLKVDRAATQREAEQNLKQAQHTLAYAQEELNQLKKMYDADDLTEETEEIILKRQQWAVEAASFGLDRVALQTERTLNVILPRRDEDWKDRLKDTEVALDRSQTLSPLTLSQKKITLAKMQQDYDRSVAVLERLMRDRANLYVNAPADGVVYYGRYEAGGWKDAAAVAANMRLDGGFRPNVTLVTIVDNQKLRVHASAPEKMLYRVSPKMIGWATPAGLPDAAQRVTVESVDPVSVTPGQYEVTLKLEGPAPMVNASMTCNIRLTSFSDDKALTVPLSALNLDDPLSPRLQVRGEKDSVITRPVKIGWRTDTQAQIVEGLKAGEWVRTRFDAAAKENAG
ncbi:MAG: hypothetical protein GC162_07160 [Planctomycetes bacterium]|nr:hypothetical protein [Planctomycetota bacterium]